ncbi:MAG TPA: fatty acid desaturase [Gammaproteobacteria bacterium]|nr:fatty acid desaturase [Gammaproteobacteria bacterium]
MKSSPLHDVTFDSAMIEWPTWLLLVATYGSWVTLTLNWAAIPGWILWLLAGYTVALHSSLQHEAIHGHPTRNTRLNLALAWPPLTLWLPIELYLENHMRHHRNELTNPESDPESFFLPRERWQRLRPWQQSLLIANNSFVGRILIGPWLAIGQQWRAEFARLRAGNLVHAGILARHAASVAALLFWLLAICDMPLHVYLLAFVWPGTSLMLVRSFLEHRYDPEETRRTVLVDGCPLTRLLFLNNNYHWIHHYYPGLPWYRIPTVARQQRDEVLARNGNYTYSGYWSIAWQYLLKPWTHPAYPS